jgi:predicted CoA-binding protein
MQSDAELRDLLRRVRSIAVVHDRCPMVEHRRLLGTAG